jgi:hypothetical protein
LELAEAGMTLLAQPGVCNQTNGEVFPISVPESVALVGMDWEECILSGHGIDGSEQTIHVALDASAFRKFTLVRGEPAEPQWEIGIMVLNDGILIDSIRVNDRPLYSVLRSQSSEDVVI